MALISISQAVDSQPTLWSDAVVIFIFHCTWWHHQMKTFSALLVLCAGNSPVTGEFPAQRPVTRSFDVVFDLRLTKRLSKQSQARWFETPSCPLWRHSNDVLYPSSVAKHIQQIPWNIHMDGLVFYTSFCLTLSMKLKTCSNFFISVSLLLSLDIKHIDTALSVSIYVDTLCSQIKECFSKYSYIIDVTWKWYWTINRR